MDTEMISLIAATLATSFAVGAALRQSIGPQGQALGRIHRRG